MGDAKKKPAAARGPKRASPRGRAGATTPPAPAPAPVVAVAVPVVPATLNEQLVDEEQVQAAFGAHSHHTSEDSIASSITAGATAAAAPVAISGTAVGGGAAAGVVPTDATSLQSLAQQQDAYRRKLEQLQKQHELQQQQWQARQQAHLQQQLKLQEQAERQDRMQHIQQKLHERIQQKQLHGGSAGSSGSPSPVASAQAAAATAAAAAQHMRQAIIRKEGKELSQSLAEHQIQLYKAMMRDLEMQSGISMTPLPSPATPVHHQQQQIPIGGAVYGTSPHTTGVTAGVAAAATSSAELIPAPIIPGTTLDPSTTKAYEDFQRARQEQLLRLQQYQMEQSKKMQQEVGTSASPAVRTQMVASEDAIRQQLLTEQERLRVLQAREVQPHAMMHSRETPMISAQEQLLIQQHDILRQQQILQGLLQRQHQERQQQQAAAARSLQQQQQQQAQQKKAPATAKKTPAPALGEGAQAPAKKRKKATFSPESQMEALVRELIRLNSATNAIEIRMSLDKVTAWVHRCFDVELLKFAQRDFREIVLAKRPSLMQANQWTSDIQVKCEYIIEKIAQVIMAISVQQTAKAQESASSSSAAAGTASTEQSNAIRLAAKEHAYAALKAQMLQPKGKSKAGGAAASKASSSQGGSSTGGEKMKHPLLVDLSLINPKQKATNAKGQQKEPATQGTAVSSESAASAVAAAKPATTGATTTTASAPASTAKPAAKATNPQPKSASVAPPSAPPAPLSPRVVQQLYEVDLTSRSCTVTQEEGEDRFYIPVKSIAKVMRRALPDDSAQKGVATTSANKGSTGDRPADAVLKTDTAATAQDAQGDKENDAEEKQQADAAKHGGEPDQGDEEMKTGEEEEGPKTSFTSSVSLAALALQKRKELVQKNLLHGSSLPPIKIDDDAVVFMQECVTEFILYLTSEAKDHCAMDKKKTASLLGSHVVQGMENLGFTTYAKVLDNFNGKIKKLQDAQTQKRVEKKLQDKKQKQEQKLLEAAEAAAKAAIAAKEAASNAAAGVNGIPEAQPQAAATAGSVAPTTATETTSVKSETASTTTTSASSQQERTLMTREDRNAELQAA